MSSAFNDITSYSDAVSKLPSSFYYNKLNSFELASDLIIGTPFPGSVLPIYDASLPLPIVFRRRMNDTYRPPHGKSVDYLFSIGYGVEMGLPDGVQEICIANSQNPHFFLYHHEHRVQIKTKCCPEVPKVTKLKFSCDESVGIGVCRVGTASSQRGVILDSSGDGGHSGSDGESGSDGRSGRRGEDADCNTRVSDGGDGRPGVHASDRGGDGHNGTPGSDVILVLSGDENCLHISGSKAFDKKVGRLNGEEVIFVDCRGGDGGDGGDGGNGGNGGNGGKGGKGLTGKDANGIIGRNGGDGGNGGNGGDGGRGGNGTNGGDGGDAGNGGNCTIQVSDPKLLMFVTVSCRSGDPGTAGKRGEGGTGGGGSRAGEGGRKGKQTTQAKDGNPGKPGKEGRGGDDGAPGSPGKSGKRGKDGKVVWVVKGDHGIQKSSTCYNVQVESFDIVPTYDSGVFQPNEKVTVSGIKVTNIGGLSVPPGAVASIPSTDQIRFDPSERAVLDELKPGQSCSIPIDFHGRISDFPPTKHTRFTPSTCKIPPKN